MHSRSMCGLLVLHGPVPAVRADGDRVAHDAVLLPGRPLEPAVLDRRTDRNRRDREGALLRRVIAPELDGRIRYARIASPSLFNRT